jgi:hypothetical protein
MPILLPPALVRTNYYGWPPGPGDMYDPNADPDNPLADPSQAATLPGVVVPGNAATDEEQYFRPLERLHGMGLHAPGVGYGMQLICTLGDSTVQITPGIALDPSGKHIFLASGGAAAIGPGTDALGSFPATIGCGAGGAILDTTGYVGDCYVIAQWWESWNSGQYQYYGVNTFTDTPWLQLVTAAEYDPDIHVPLGKVSLDASSQVTKASYGDVGGIQRTSVSVPVQSVQLYRAQTATSGTVQGAETVSWGEVRAREGGGIELVTENNADQVNVITQGGGNFSSMAIAAEQATVGELSSPSIVLNSAGSKVQVGTTSNPGVVLDGSEATVYVGAPGNYGDVIVYDGDGHLSVTLAGDTGHVIVGGPTLNGEVRMLDSKAQQTMTLEGSTGSAVVQNLSAYANNTINVNASDLVNVNTTFLRCHGTDFCLDGRSHHNNRALVDWGNQLIINYDNDYHNGVIINRLQNPVGIFGQSGNWQTQIGVISGFVGANSGSNSGVTGGVTFNFSDLSFSSPSSDFDWADSWAMGYTGTFTDTPQVLFVPNLFDLTTNEVYTKSEYTAYSDHVDLTWSYNAGGSHGYQQWQILIIGPITPPY